MAQSSFRFELPAALRPLEREIATYFKELPRLIAEGQEGRVALIKGDEVVGVWDTRTDALQAGYEKFGLTTFATQPIKTRDLELYKTARAKEEATCQP